MFRDKKMVTQVTSVSLLVSSAVSLVGACFCLIGRKKNMATIFFALALIAGAVGAMVAYIVNVFERREERLCGFDECDDCWDDDLDFDDIDDEEVYSIPIDDTVNEDEFKD